MKEWLKLLINTLCYNSFITCNTICDTLMEPLFWFVDHFANYMGPIMVTLVVFLTTSVVAIFYVCIIPHIYFETNVSATVFHLVFGHWLLLNIVFNYVMACFTDPGHPPQTVPESVSICKKCISPKPPRTHHCSVCKKCILKMDHHCPWLNNCVGFYNHRYFFLFCFYMWLGTIYISYVGYDLFKQHFYGSKDIFFPGILYPLNLARNAIMSKSKPMTTSLPETGEKLEEHDGDDFIISYRDQMIHNAIIFEFMLCTGVAIALGLLWLWHFKMISRAETSIEVHINNKERKRLKKKGLIFRNPYYFGFIRNWKMFLGLRNGRTFWRHILLPSPHPPDGNGLSWKTATFQLDHPNGLRLL